MLKVKRVFCFGFLFWFLFFNSLGAFQIMLWVWESAARPRLPSLTWEKSLVQRLLKIQHQGPLDVFQMRSL